MAGLRKSSRALLWVALGAALWGTDTVFRWPLSQQVGALRIVFYEHAILTLVLLPVCWRARREWIKLTPLEWAAMLGISWGGSALGTLCFTSAIRIGNPTTAVLLQKIQPVFAIFLARILLGESLGRRFWMLLPLAAGAGWLIGFGFAWPSIEPASATAAMLAATAAALWGSSTVLGRYLLHRLSFQNLTALRIVLALPLLSAIAGRTWLNAPTSRQAGILVLLALVPGLIALLVYYRGLRGTDASRAAVAELTFPATATLLNTFLLGVRIRFVQAAGFVLLWMVIFQLQKDQPGFRDKEND